MRRLQSWSIWVGASALLGSVLLAGPSTAAEATAEGAAEATAEGAAEATAEGAAEGTAEGTAATDEVAAAAEWSPPGGATWRPPAGAIFNNPRGTTEARWRIVRTVDRTIRNAWPGSTIWITLYLMDSKPSADALIAAHARGVHVRMAVDGSEADTFQMRRISSALNADNDDIDPATGERYRDEAGNLLEWGRDESFVTWCHGGCRSGPGSFVHGKFYVFSRTGAAENVVMVSSSNLNAGGAHRGFNDLYVAHGQAALVNDPVNGFAAVLDEMGRDRPVDGERFREMTSGPYTTRFFPTTDDRDPTYQDLSSVRCRGATGGAGRNGRTIVAVSMFMWMDQRGVRFARKIVELGKAGCDVRILLGASGKEPRRILAAAARRRQIKVWDTRVDKNCDTEAELRVHHKYMLISGSYRGDTSSWLVHTGSQNWARDTTRYADDNTINIARRDAFGAYLRNFSWIRDRYGTRIPHDPVICP